MIFPIKAKWVVKSIRTGDYEKGESINELFEEETYHEGIIYDVVTLSQPEHFMVNSGKDNENRPIYSETVAQNTGVYFLFAKKTENGYKMHVVDVGEFIIDDKDMNEYVKSRWQKM